MENSPSERRETPTSQPFTRPLTTRDEIATILAKLGLHYPKRNDLSDEERKVLWAQYLDDLTTCPANVVARACERWRRSPARFFPSVGELLEECRQVAADLEAKAPANLIRGVTQRYDSLPTPEAVRIAEDTLNRIAGRDDGLSKAVRRACETVLAKRVA